MGPRAGLEVLEKGKSFAPASIETPTSHYTKNAFLAARFNAVACKINYI